MISDKFSNIMNLFQALDHISGKWFLVIIIAIFMYNRINFYRLKKSLNPITSKLLSGRLKKLENLELVARKVMMESPLRVEYYLTEKGKELAKVLMNLVDYNHINKKF